MAEKVAKLGVWREKDFMYYVKDGEIWKVQRKQLGVPKGHPEKVADGGFEVDANYIYFVDRDGDVSRASRDVSIPDEDEDGTEDDIEDDEGYESLHKNEAHELLYTLFPDLTVPKSTKQIQLIQDQATRIFKMVAVRDDLEKLTPRQLEELLAEVFSREGYEAHLTPATRDGGRDVIAVLPGPLPILVVAEAKKMKLVEPNLVLALSGVRDRDKANVGLLATTGRFSPDTRRMVKKTWSRLIELKDGEEFMDWIRRLKQKPGAH